MQTHPQISARKLDFIEINKKIRKYQIVDFSLPAVYRFEIMESKKIWNIRIVILRAVELMLYSRNTNIKHNRQAQIHRRTLLFRYEPFSEFSSSTRGERHNSYNAGHTIWPHKALRILKCLRSLSVEICKTPWPDINFSTSWLDPNFSTSLSDPTSHHHD